MNGFKMMELLRSIQDVLVMPEHRERMAEMTGVPFNADEVEAAKSVGVILYADLAATCDQVRELQAAQREAAAIEQTRLANGSALGYCMDSDMEGQWKRDIAESNDAYAAWKAGWTPPLPGETCGDWARRQGIASPGRLGHESRGHWWAMVEAVMMEVSER